MSDAAGLGGPIIPADTAGLDAAGRELGLLAGELRAVARRQAGHLRALHGWTGRGHEAWAASTERTGRAALAVAAVLAEAAAVLRYLRRAVPDLRWRSATLAARALVAGYEVGPDASVRRIGGLLPASPPGAPPLHQPAGPTLRPRSPEAFQAELEGRGLAGQADPWRIVQLELAGLLDDACTAFAAARSGLRRIADDQDRASTAPRSAHLPDGGGYPISGLAAAVAATQLPGARQDLWELTHRRGGEAPGPAGRSDALPVEVARVVAERRLSRAVRMSAAARALDRVVAAAGRVPLVAVATVPIGRIPPLRPTGVLGRLPIADVALAGWSVQQDVRQGYSVPAAVGREGTSTVAGFAAAEGSGYLIVVLGGAPASAAIIAVGVGLLVGQLAGSLFDKVTHHGR